MVNPIRSALSCIAPQTLGPEVAPQEQQGPCGRPVGGYREIGMAQSGWSKDVQAWEMGEGPRYLSPIQRRQYEVTVGKDDHLLYQRGPEGQPVRIHTRDNDKFLYAMDKDGHIYAAPDSEVRHHSAFLAGQPGAAFGLLSVKDGEIQYLDNESGHYLPPADHGYQMLHELRARGVEVPNERIVLRASRSQIRKAGRAPTMRLCPDATKVKAKKY